MYSTKSFKSDSIEYNSLPSVPCAAAASSPLLMIKEFWPTESNGDVSSKNLFLVNRTETAREKQSFEGGPVSETIMLPKLKNAEIEFMHLVSKNDTKAIECFFEDHPDFDVNCSNFQGVTALHLAVRNDSEEMVHIFLQNPKTDVGDAVLQAVKHNNIKLLVMLLDARKKQSPGLEFAGVTHSAEFYEHVTPLMLAAQLGHFEMVNVLKSRGHTIVRPHPPECACRKCLIREAQDDPLFTSSARLSTYRAIASPVYLVQMTSDPILFAFQLYEELTNNASSYLQFATAYLKLRHKVSNFAVELLGCCRTSEETALLLKQTAGTFGRQFVLPRLVLAVYYKQKDFVAHPNTQQVLESYWIGDWYRWKRKSSTEKLFIIISRVFITPFILIMTVIAPWHSLVRHWSIPLNKLITHVSAYCVFLALVFIVSNQDKSTQKRGPPHTGAEFPLALYVFGYAWSATRMCLMYGPRRYFGELWNWAEITMLALFGLTFIFWIMAAIQVANNVKIVDEERKYWGQYEPTLLAEGTFCLATIFAYLRLMLYCQLNYHLGPLQVSLGKMTIDIYRYIIVFAIIISAFAAGLARFYEYYDGMVYEDDFGMKTVQVSSFTSLTDTLNTLFWALFCMAPLESADVVLENTRHCKNNEKHCFENRHTYTERIGYICFGCFEVLTVIVVLNMLIATMSNTFQQVNDNVAREWTYGRTQLYLEYMSQTVLPSPYNMIPTAAALSGAFEWIRNKILPKPGVHARWSPSFCFYIERELEPSVQKEHAALMSVLVQRYFNKNRLTIGVANDTVRATQAEKELETIYREVKSLKAMMKKTGNIKSMP